MVILTVSHFLQINVRMAIFHFKVLEKCCIKNVTKVLILPKYKSINKRNFHFQKQGQLLQDILKSLLL